MMAKLTLFLQRYWETTKILVPMALNIALSFAISTSLSIFLLALVGRNDTTASAAMGLFNLYNAVTGVAFCSGFLSAQSTLSSYAFGRYEKALQCHPVDLTSTTSHLYSLSRICQRACFMMFLALFPISAFWLTSEPILLRLGQDSAVAALVGSFNRIYLPFFPFFVLTTILKNHLQAQRLTGPVIWSTLIANVLAGILGYILIYHTSLQTTGFPIAFGSASVLNFVILLVYIIRKGTVWKWITLSELFERGETLEFISLGFPGAIILFAEWLGFEIHSFFAGWIGTTTLAAQAILLNTNFMAFSLPLGQSIAANVMVGIEEGKDQREEAKWISEVALINGFLSAVVISVVYWTCHAVWGQIFTSDPSVVALVAQILPVMGVFVFSDFTGNVVGGVLRGLKLYKTGAAVNVISFYGVGITLGYLLAFKADWGLSGLWAGLAAASGVNCLTLLIILRVYFWYNRDRTVE